MELPPQPGLTLALAAARARWPGLALEAAALTASVAAVAATAADVAARGDELVLAHAAAAGDAAAVAAFEREVMPRARAAIGRYLRDAGRTDEVAQQLRIHLLVGDGARPRLARFDARAPLAAWVAMCAARLALHALRDTRRHDDVAVEWSDALSQLVVADPVVEALRARWASEIATALRDACGDLSRRHRAIVRLVFVEAASTDEVAAVYGVHRVTVWRWVQEAQEVLRDGVRRRLREAIPTASLPPEALVAWLDDQVMLSLDRVLSPTVTDVRG
ncbi:MAG: sigma-70 family RNA polymerase sigma factor [Kofleriaceae bacterium]